MLHGGAGIGYKEQEVLRETTQQVASCSQVAAGGTDTHKSSCLVVDIAASHVPLLVRLYFTGDGGGGYQEGTGRIFK